MNEGTNKNKRDVINPEWFIGLSTGRLSQKHHRETSREDNKPALCGKTQQQRR